MSIVVAVVPITGPETEFQNKNIEVHEYWTLAKIFFLIWNYYKPNVKEKNEHLNVKESINMLSITCSALA